MAGKGQTAQILLCIRRQYVKRSAKFILDFDPPGFPSMMFGLRSRLPCRWVIFIVTIGHVFVASLLTVSPTFKTTITPSTLTSDGGFAFISPIKIGLLRLYAVATDDNGAPTISALQLFENGQPLGPAHAVHADVRNKGAGNFSHWQNGLIFSASDNSDPRSNGRVYSVSSPTQMRLRLQLPMLMVVALADFVLFWIFQTYIMAFGKQHWRTIVAGAAVFGFIALVVATVGLFGPVVLARPGPGKDAALVIATVLHSGLGSFILVGMWVAGAGLMTLSRRQRHARLADILMPAFPLGMVLLAILVAVALLLPFGRLLAIGFWITCLLPLVRWRPPYHDVRSLLRAAIVITPLSLVFGVWIALLWHGPTDTLSGSPTGDLTWYVGNTWSLAQFPYPNLDLGYEATPPRFYFNQLIPALGSTLLCVPGFDPFLFLLAGGACAYVLLTGLALHLYASDRAPDGYATRDIVLIVIAILAAARYPYWVVETIPLVFVPALTMSVLWMSERGLKAPIWYGPAMAAALIGSILSKVISGTVIGPLTAAYAVSHIKRLPRTALLALTVLATMFALYCVYMLNKFLPLMLGAGNIGPEGYRVPHWTFIARDAASVILAMLSWAIAPPAVAAALTFGVVCFIVFSWALQVTFVCVAILIGLLTASRPRSSTAVRVVALAALVLSLPATLLEDPAGHSSGLMWIICLGGASLAALMPQERGWFTARSACATAFAICSIATVAFIGVARGPIIVDSGLHFYARDTLTPDVKRIWSDVRTKTPVDALVFTDQVDDTINLLGGWNSFSFSGQRQVYISSYYNNGVLRNDPDKLHEVLTLNADVLAGRLSPRDIPVRYPHTHYYAVVSAARAPAAAWREIAGNKGYTLYNITP